MRRWSTRCAALAAGALLGAGAALAAPIHPDFQDDAPRYAGALLPCAVFREQVRSRISSRRVATLVEDRAGRDGVLVIRTADSAGQLVVEAWYDSLTVWRETAEGRELPDVEGFVGGRFRGTLSPTGVFHATARPFVPGDLAALTNLASAFDDFLPVLPVVPLEVGERWSDGAGREVRRRAADRQAGQRVRRYEWTLRHSAQAALVPGDSGGATVTQQTSETGELSWAARFGPFAWYRKIDVEATVPPRGGVTQPLVSTVRQEIWVTRAPGHPACAGTMPEGRTG